MVVDNLLLALEDCAAWAGRGYHGYIRLLSGLADTEYRRERIQKEASECTRIAKRIVANVYNRLLNHLRLLHRRAVVFIPSHQVVIDVTQLLGDHIVPHGILIYHAALQTCQVVLVEVILVGIASGWVGRRMRGIDTVVESMRI